MILHIGGCTAQGLHRQPRPRVPGTTSACSVRKCRPTLQQLLTHRPRLFPNAVKASKGDQQGPETPPEHGVTAATRQLLSLTALGIFTLVATVARDRATSPIVPPLIPVVQTAAPSPDGSSTTYQGATATFEASAGAEVEQATSDKGHVKPSRSLLRALWGTATAPVKLVDNLLFPEEDLLGSASKQHVSSADSTTHKGKQHSSSSSRSSNEAAASRAAAGQAASATASSTGFAEAADVAAPLLAEDSTTPDAAALPHSSSPDVLQQALARMLSSKEQDGAVPGTSPAPAADHAAVLAAVRVLLGPDSMGLLPVLLVTSATAAAGLMLAASLAGVAGLMDGNKAATPARRAAQVALLDSPLRPISCYTWPGFLPVLPANIGPHYYRWRDSSTDTASVDTTGSTSDSTSTPAAAQQASGAAVDGAAGGPDQPAPLAAEAGQEQQEWWSFAQIAALRMMPLLPTSGSSSNPRPAGTHAAAAAASSTAVAATVAADGPVGDTAQSVGGFCQLQTELSAAVSASLTAHGGIDLHSEDASVVFGPAWDLAMQLAACDTLAAPDVTWDLFHRFGSTADEQLLAEVCCLLPAAVVNCRAAVAASSGSKGIGQQHGASESRWDQAGRLLAMLLGDMPPEGLQSLAKAMGLVGLNQQPEDFYGLLQLACHQYLQQVVELENFDGLSWGEVPETQEWLRHCKQQRVAMSAVGLRSCFIAALTVLELWQAAASAKIGASDTDCKLPAGPACHGHPMVLSRMEALQRLAAVGQEPLPLQRLACDLLVACDQDRPALQQLEDPHDDKEAWRLFGQQLSPGSPAVCSSYGSERLQRLLYEDALRRLSQDSTMCDSLSLSLAPAQGSAQGTAPWFDEERLMDWVVTALHNGVLVVKPITTVCPCPFRPEWPAAQQLALLEILMLPSVSARLLQHYVACTQSHMLARTCALLPAAVTHVRDWRQECYDIADVYIPWFAASQQEPEPEAVCMRMYAALLSPNNPHPEAASELSEVFHTLGLHPAAVATVAATAREPGTTSPAAAAAVIQGASFQHLQRISKDSLLAKVLEEYMDAPDFEDLDLEIGHSILLSTTVCLALLLDLSSSRGWALADGGWSSTGPDMRNPAHLPGWFWALMAAHFAESNLRVLPGSVAAAAVLQAAMDESEVLAQAPNEHMQPADYELACARLRVAVAGYGDEPCSYKEWHAGMSSALAAHQGYFDGEEEELEADDYGAAADNGFLPWVPADDGCESPSASAAASWDEQCDEEADDYDVPEADCSCDEAEAEQAAAEDAATAAAAAVSATEAAAAAPAAADDAEVRHMLDYADFRHLLNMATCMVTCQVLLPIKQLAAAAADSLGEAWEVALLLALIDARCDAVVTRDALQLLASRAAPTVVAEVGALLPAAVVNVRAIVAANASRGEGWLAPGIKWAGDGSNWDDAARLLGWLLTPAAHDDAAASAAGDPSLLRQVCAQLGLCHTHACNLPGHNWWRRKLSGVLQERAAAYGRAAAEEARSRLIWGPAAGADVKRWVLAQHKQPQQLAGMALRSCVMTSYMAMELWYARDCPLLQSAHSCDSSTSSDSTPHEAQPKVLFSHCGLLQALNPDSNGTLQLHRHVAVASKLAAAVYSRVDDDRPVDGLEEHGECAEAQALLIMNCCMEVPCCTGKLPDLATYPAFLASLQAVQQDMGEQLRSPHLDAALSATEGTAVNCGDDADLVEGVVDALVAGQVVVLLPVASDRLLDSQLVGLPEWAAAGQLAALYGCLPVATGDALLQRFAAVVTEDCLARICCLLPLAVHSFSRELSRAGAGYSSAGLSTYVDDYEVKVARYQHMLRVLAAAAGCSGSGAPLLPHIGMAAPAVVAAIAAASAAIEAPVDAAVAAIEGPSLQVEQPGGFVQQLWMQLDRCPPAVKAGVITPVFTSIAAAVVGLLGVSADSDAASPPALPVAATSSSPAFEGQSPDNLWLPFSAWTLLAAQFAAIHAGNSSSNNAAVAALLQQGVLAAQAREQRLLPEALRVNLLHTLRKGHGLADTWYSDFLADFDERLAAPWGGVSCFQGVKRQSAGKPLATRAARQSSTRVAAAGGAAEPDAAAAGGAGASEQYVYGRYRRLSRGDAQLQQDQAHKEHESPERSSVTGLVSEAPAAAAAAGAVAMVEVGPGHGNNVSGSAWYVVEEYNRMYREQQAVQQQEQRPGLAEDGSVSGTNNKKMQKKKKKIKQGQQAAVDEAVRGGAQAGKAVEAATAAAAVEDVPKAAAVAGKGNEDSAALAHTATAADDPVLYTVKQILGLPVDPADASSSAQQVPNRLALLLCQAMLLRGEHAKSNLMAAVGYLATCSMSDTLQLPVMLAGCMEALFTSDDWASPSGSALEVRKLLWAALPSSSFRELDMHLVRKGLLKEPILMG